MTKFWIKYNDIYTLLMEGKSSSLIITQSTSLNKSKEINIISDIIY
jgi:hypothetical protein